MKTETKCRSVKPYRPHRSGRQGTGTRAKDTVQAASSSPQGRRQPAHPRASSGKHHRRRRTEHPTRTATASSSTGPKTGEPRTVRQRRRRGQRDEEETNDPAHETAAVAAEEGPEGNPERAAELRSGDLRARERGLQDAGLHGRAHRGQRCSAAAGAERSNPPHQGRGTRRPSGRGHPEGRSSRSRPARSTRGARRSCSAPRGRPRGESEDPETDDTEGRFFSKADDAVRVLDAVLEGRVRGPLERERR